MPGKSATACRPISPAPRHRGRTEFDGNAVDAVEEAVEMALRRVEHEAVDWACDVLARRDRTPFRRGEDHLGRSARLIRTARSVIGTITSPNSSADVSLRICRRIKRRLIECGSQREVGIFWAIITSDDPKRAADLLKAARNGKDGVS